jgi:hypothetical protein
VDLRDLELLDLRAGWGWCWSTRSSCRARALEAAALPSRRRGQKVVDGVRAARQPGQVQRHDGAAARGVEVLTSRQVLAAMPAIHKKRVAGVL